MLYQLAGAPIVEIHNENLMRLFVRDANGAPVGGAHVKVWAGPPPSGDPPYFKDDSPFRPTSPSGMLEYLTVAGRMPETRDYWMQVLDNSGTPLSDPLQFHFPGGSTIWITATVQAGGGTPIDGGNQPPLNVQWDDRLTPMHVSINAVAGLAPGKPYWKIISAQYQDETQSGGNHNLYYTVLDEHGIPAPGVPVVQDWQGRDPNDVPNTVYTDANGTANNGLYAGPVGWNPNAGPGPYSGWVGDPDLRGRNLTGIPGEKIVGVGLPMNRHVNYVVTWRKSVAGGVSTGSSIAGTLTNAPAGTQVTLSGPVTQTTTPDAAGHYAFNNLAAGTYSISITGAGAIRSNIVLDGTNSVQVDYAFPATPAQKSRLSGSIKNAPGNLLLTLASATQTFTTTSDASGNYVFDNLPAGTFSLTVAGVGLVNPAIVLDGTNAITFNYTVIPQPPSRPLVHYLLFGSPSASATRTNLVLALDYVARFAPTVGFSITDAKSAQNVTIVGAGAVSASDEQQLKDAGCTVRHIAGPDSYAVEQLFAQLIASGNPYPST